MNKLVESLKDGNDQISSMRLVWSITMIMIISTWCYLAISNGEIPHFEMADTLWISVLFSSKPLQKFIENKNDLKVKDKL